MGPCEAWRGGGAQSTCGGTTSEWREQWVRALWSQGRKPHLEAGGFLGGGRGSPWAPLGLRQGGQRGRKGCGAGTRIQLATVAFCAEWPTLPCSFCPQSNPARWAGALFSDTETEAERGWVTCRGPRKWRFYDGVKKEQVEFQKSLELRGT